MNITNLLNNCCGCGNCINVCPKNAISFIEERTGFYFPFVDQNKCIQCSLCRDSCPQLYEKQIMKNSYPSFLYRSADLETRKNSASGGACYDVSKAIIDDGGVVCGCSWDNEFNAKHIIVENLCELKKLQGTKYVQSDLGDCFIKLEAFIKDNRKILFIGTPCQGQAFYSFLKVKNLLKYENNILIGAIICHGISSPIVWKNWKSFLEKKNHGKITSINLRDKTKKGYKMTYSRYSFNNGKVVYLKSYLQDEFILSGIVYNLSLRNVCTNCLWKGINTNVDFYFGDQHSENSGDGKYGTSCIIVSSKKGYDFLQKKICLIEWTFDKIIKTNKYLLNSCKIGQKRDLFLSSINDSNLFRKFIFFLPLKGIIKQLTVKLGIYNLYLLLRRKIKK